MEQTVLTTAVQAAVKPVPSIMAGGLAVALAVVHLYAGRLRFLSVIPRSRWLSAASGVSVAYVFVHLLPDLQAHQQVFDKIPALAALEHHVYLMALLGLVVFYGLERVVRTARQRPNLEADSEATAPSSDGIFWLHISSFALYNALIGYLLVHREEPGMRSLFIFFIAMALHFVVNDYGLRQDHQSMYHHTGRWILAAAIIAGWAVGQGMELSEAAIAVLFAFLAGGVILNVLKEELPEERQSNFAAFAIGSVTYASLLLTLSA